jgi:hypothetical protein
MSVTNFLFFSNFAILIPHQYVAIPTKLKKNHASFNIFVLQGSDGCKNFVLFFFFCRK